MQAECGNVRGQCNESRWAFYATTLRHNSPTTSRLHNWRRASKQRHCCRIRLTGSDVATAPHSLDRKWRSNSQIAGHALSTRVGTAAAIGVQSAWRRHYTRDAVTASKADNRTPPNIASDPIGTRDVDTDVTGQAQLRVAVLWDTCTCTCTWSRVKIWRFTIACEKNLIPRDYQKNDNSTSWFYQPTRRMLWFC